MDQAIDALVTGYEDLIPDLNQPDPDDRHVLAAAIRGEADVIVTMNPVPVLANLGIRVQHPDDFVGELLDVAPAAVLRAAQDHWRSLRKPSMKREEYLATLTRQGLTRTGAVLSDLWPEGSISAK